MLLRPSLTYQEKKPFCNLSLNYWSRGRMKRAAGRYSQQMNLHNCKKNHVLCRPRHWSTERPGLGVTLLMLINQCECVCDQDLCKLIRATSQLVRVSVTPQNLICTSWSATDHKARSVRVPQGVSCCKVGALQNSAHQMLHGVH